MDCPAPESIVAFSISSGTVVGRYQILAPVGRGGMSEVYAAYDPELDRKVALKLLRAPGELEDDGAQARLRREAQAMARLSHPNVVAAHDVGTFGTRVFMAMEFVDGTTLKDWLAERPRSRPEILAVFAAAARGLSAAHGVGLVHRDFKPGNVMIGRDGSVRVMDFGLVRRIADRRPIEGIADLPRGEDVAAALTMTGELVGTPLFMAPEQFQGQPSDARTDQFSFCVALHLALYGLAPFGAARLDTIKAKVLSGVVAPAPADSAVAPWLRRVLLRGLSLDPADRWPSMDELVAALTRDPARARRRRAAAVGLSIVALLSAFTISRGVSRPARLCLGGPARLADVWEGTTSPGTPRPRREAVEKSFLATGAPGARDAWDRVSALLDRYRGRWLAMYQDACEATHVRGQQSAALLDLRMTCLDERRLALASLTSVFASADRRAVTSAVDATNALPALERCADRAQLEAPIEPPRDQATRERVEDLRRRAAIAKALNDTGKHREAQDAARAQLAEARALGYRPLVAEALMALTSYFEGVNFDAGVVPINEEAVWTSLAVGRDDLGAEAAVALVGFTGGYLARDEEGRAWASLANAILDRMGGSPDLLRSWLLQNQAVAALHHHDPARALELARRSISLKQKILPPDHPDLAHGFNGEAEALAELERYDEAVRLSERAYDIDVRAYGPLSIEAGEQLGNRAEYLVALGRSAEAVEPLRRALAIFEAQLGAEHQFVAYPLTALGRALLALARPREAAAPLERALRIREAVEHDATLVAETRFALARAEWDASVDRARSLELARKAHATYMAAADGKHAAEIGAWLAARATPPGSSRR